MERISRSKGPTTFLHRQETLRSDVKLRLAQPYKNKEHSVGAIYLSILNLPRTERFKFENSLIIGMIPGPKEPSLHVNSDISPMVEELLLFWEGQLVRESGSIGHSFYRIALLAISSDIPATRKFGGFLSFNAEQGMGNVCR